MTKQHIAQPLPLLLLMFVIFIACVPQTPIPIYVTPTPQVGPVVEGQLTLTENSQALVPTTDGALMPTIDVASVVSSTPSNTPHSVPPSGTFGPIIGPDYEIPPTATPRPPTAEPTEPPTATIPIGTPLPMLDKSRMGVQVYYNMEVDDFQSIMFYADQIGVEWVKFQASWRFLQPNGPGDFDQSYRLFQLHVQEADKRGFKVLISIAKAPDWSRNVNRNEDGPPDNPQDLVNFINNLMDTIGSHIDAIEIWNEPNLQREWTGALPFNGAGYMQLFAPAHQAIRARSSTMIILTSGLAPTGNSPGSVDDREFLRQMYGSGLFNYRDIGIGIHPYGWGNPPDARCCDAIDGQGWDDDPHFFFLNTIEEYRDIMVQYGHNDILMWPTEFGWATWEGIENDPPQPWMVYNNALQQANYTVWAFEWAQQQPYLGPMMLWNLNFANEILLEQRNEIAAYSIFLPTQIRPLYYLLRDRPQG